MNFCTYFPTVTFTSFIFPSKWLYGALDIPMSWNLHLIHSDATELMFKNSWLIQASSMSKINLSVTVNRCYCPGFGVEAPCVGGRQVVPDRWVVTPQTHGSLSNVKTNSSLTCAFASSHFYSSFSCLHPFHLWLLCFFRGIIYVFVVGEWWAGRRGGTDIVLP